MLNLDSYYFFKFSNNPKSLALADGLFIAIGLHSHSTFEDNASSLFLWIGKVNLCKKAKFSLQTEVCYTREKHNVGFSAFTLTVKANFKFQLEVIVYKPPHKNVQFLFSLPTLSLFIRVKYWTMGFCFHMLMWMPWLKKVIK